MGDKSTLTAAVCSKCTVTYTPEQEDLGVCCGCFRDLAYARVYGPNWRGALGRAVNRDHLFGELVKALKVYADPEHWQEMTGEFLVHETDDDDRIIWDAGQIARAVLAKVKGEGHG